MHHKIFTQRATQEDLPPQGSLTEFPAYTILKWASEVKYCGNVLFERGNRVKHIYFKEGDIIGIASNLIQENLAKILDRHFLSDTDQSSMNQFLSQPPSVSHSDPQTLLRLNQLLWIPKELISKALEVQNVQRLINLMGWFSGQYKLEEGKSPSEGTSMTKRLKLESFFQALERFILEGDNFFHLGEKSEPIGENGDLSKMGSYALIMALADRRATGTLLFQREGRRKRLRWQQGKIISVSSSDPQETLSKILKRLKILEERQVIEIEALAKKRKVKIRELLQEKNLLDQTQIAECLFILHTERILESFSWWSGSYQFKGNLNEESLVNRLQKILLWETEEETERDHKHRKKPHEVLAKTLNEFFQSTDKRSLLFTEIPFQKSLYSDIEKVGKYWGKNDIRILVIRLGKKLKNGSKKGSWKNWVERSDIKNIDFISCTRSSDLKKWNLTIAEQYHRLIWITKDITKEKNLLSEVSSILFVLSAKTRKADLTSLLSKAPREKMIGFIFRES